MHKKLDIKAFSLAIGLMWASAVALLSIIASASDHYLHNITNFLSSIYLGYDLTFIGILIGIFWAFLDAAIGGFVFAWIYNKLAK